VVYSLNHDVMASFTLDSDPELPKTNIAFVSVTKYGRTHMLTNIIERYQNT